MAEVFAKPAVSAIIEKAEGGAHYILMQRRQKADGGATNGLWEVVGGKIREYENIFDALRREVWEETGLRIIRIEGEETAQMTVVDGVKTMVFTPFCTVQNLCGIYSLIMHTFLCTAEGEPCGETDEATEVHWERVEEIQKLLSVNPQSVFPMDILPLTKYLQQF